jgi:hypothetical protein
MMKVGTFRATPRYQTLAITGKFTGREKFTLDKLTPFMK